MRNYLSHIGVCLGTVPRANLGSRWNCADDEALFVRRFIASYDKRYAWLHSGSSRLNRAMAREVPVNGFGIADLVTVSWDTKLGEWTESRLSTVMCPTVRAFEFKLSDWRRGMMQAHRYRFFADASILVIPAKKIELAYAFLETFRKVDVGLWGFNQDTGAIVTLFTPRPRRPAVTGHRSKAVASVIEATMRGLPSS